MEPVINTIYHSKMSVKQPDKWQDPEDSPELVAALDEAIRSIEEGKTHTIEELHNFVDTWTLKSSDQKTS